MSDFAAQQKEDEKIFAKDLEDKILIDFFITIGLPTDICIELCKKIESYLEKNPQLDFSCEEVFEKVVFPHFQQSKVIQSQTKEMILNLYPDCINEGKMKDSDPRKNFIDIHKINMFPKYAFPLGYEPVLAHQSPKIELVPMAFVAGGDNVYVQYLVFYENLETQIYQAFKQSQKVQVEIDNNNFSDASSLGYDPDGENDEDDNQFDLLLEPKNP